MIAIGPIGIGGLVVVVVVVVVLLWMLKNMINIVQQGEVGVVKRLGEYRKTHEPGLVIIAPFVDGLQRVDMREIPRPGDRQEVITKDNVVVTVNATIFTQIVDAKQALFSIAKFDVAIDALARTALALGDRHPVARRGAVGAGADQHRRAGKMEVVTDKWGIRISRIEIVEIAPPPQILQALALQKTADQEKRAKILQSEGNQQAAINIADGAAKAAIRVGGGRASGGDPARRGQPSGRDPRGRGPSAGDRQRLRRDPSREARPGAHRHPAARHAEQVRRQRQRQDRRALRERRVAGCCADTQISARRDPHLTESERGISTRHVEQLTMRRRTTRRLAGCRKAGV